MKLLISNTLILPMTERGLWFYGDVGIDGSTIAFVGQPDPAFRADRVIDGSNHLVMPALINAHTHLSMVLMRNYKDGLPTLQEWLDQIFPIEDTLVEEDILIASRLGIAELIQSGVATFSDMYFHPSATAQAVIEGGVRANLGLTFFGDEAESLKRIEEREESLRSYRNQADGRITLSAAPHAIYTCTEGTYRLANRWARENGALLHTHLSETKEEVDYAQKTFGKTPLGYLLDSGALQGVKGLFAHGVHLSEADLEILASLECAIVHNPSSNLKLSCGIAAVSTYLKHSIPMALGTDGASSNNNLNMVEEMHLAALLGRLESDLLPYDVVSMATVGGAEALALGDRIGRLKPGMDADLIMINLNTPHLTPLNDPFSALVYSAQASDIDTLLCRGKILMEGRRVNTIDTERAIDHLKSRWEEIQSR